MQDSGPITTETSKSDGRLIVATGGCSHGKKKCLKCVIFKNKKDGKGGPGKLLPTGVDSVTSLVPSSIRSSPSAPTLSPGAGVAVTPNTYTPQQKSQMASAGMTPTGLIQPQGSASKSLPRFNRFSNKPHRSMAGTRSPRSKKLKNLKIKSLKSVVRAANKRA